MKIIKPRRDIENKEYERSFAWRDYHHLSAGFSFSCDADGNFLPMVPAAEANLQRCLDGTYDVIDEGIRCRKWTHTEPAVGQCRCGAEVELDGFTNTCDNCHADYNWAGQLLAPRSQWGEETGEHLSDILRIP
jgi:hypothetical protein